MKKMLNKLFKLFGYELVKLQSLKDIDFEADGKNPYDQPIEDPEAKIYYPKEDGTYTTKHPVKEVVKPKVKKKQTSISILFRDGVRLTWEYLSNIDDKRFPYTDLYIWYFSKTTPIFMFEHKDGETIFRREDILRIERSKTIIVDKD